MDRKSRLPVVRSRESSLSKASSISQSREQLFVPGSVVDHQKMDRKSRLPVARSRESSLSRASSISRSREQLFVPGSVVRSSVRTQSARRSRSLTRPTLTPVVVRQLTLKRSNSFVNSRYDSHLKAPGSSSVPPKSPLRKDPIGDKQWQARQIVKINGFLKDNIEDTDLKYLRAPSLPSNNAFVAIANILLHYIEPQYNLNPHNYMHLFPNILKMLGYNGNLKASVFKTVNTASSFPHILSFFGFLVDLIFTLQEASKEGQIEMTRIDHIVEVFKTASPNMNEDTKEKLESLHAEFSEVMSELHEFKQEELDAMNEEINKFVALKEERQKQIDEENMEIKQLEEQIMEKEQEIKNVTETYPAEISVLDKEIENISDKRNKLEKEEENLNQEMRDLMSVISKQSVSVKSIQEMQAKIEDLKYSKTLGQKQYEQTVALKEKFDLDEFEYKRNVEKKIFDFNASVTPLALIFPKINELVLPVQDFRNDDYCDKLKQCLDDKKKILKEVKDKLHETEKNLVLKRHECEKLKEQSSLESKEIDNLNRVLFEIQLELDQTIKGLSKIKNEIEDRRQEYELKMKEVNFLTRAEFYELVEHLQNLTKQKIDYETDFINMQKEEIADLTNSHNNSVRFLNEVMGYLRQMVSEIDESVCQEILNLYKNLQDLRKSNE